MCVVKVYVRRTSPTSIVLILVSRMFYGFASLGPTEEFPVLLLISLRDRFSKAIYYVFLLLSFCLSHCICCHTFARVMHGTMNSLSGLGWYRTQVITILYLSTAFFFTTKQFDSVF